MPNQNTRGLQMYCQSYQQNLKPNSTKTTSTGGEALEPHVGNGALAMQETRASHQQSVSEWIQHIVQCNPQRSKRDIIYMAKSRKRQYRAERKQLQRGAKLLNPTSATRVLLWDSINTANSRKRQQPTEDSDTPQDAFRHLQGSTGNQGASVTVRIVGVVKVGCARNDKTDCGTGNKAFLIHSGFDLQSSRSKEVKVREGKAPYAGNALKVMPILQQPFMTANVLERPTGYRISLAPVAFL
ncbi:hypothetical protein GEV33_001583 [Tenebrio molitor]|uniref:Uncharacterized protein n=1 Tax=Tenebrio molitor TaxID=7067 RepID=A0A8J6HXA5_TENMO|nr:hypothetical protein GEV33_001583 [Tenebrio molitor]